jgi:hypothetical protein
MALSNPLRGERRPGAVGAPLPGVEARLAEDGEALVVCGACGCVGGGGWGVGYACVRTLGAGGVGSRAGAGEMCLGDMSRRSSW